MILRGKVFSEVLDMDTSITFITPDDYKAKECKKVAYCLHGMSGTSDTWADYSMLPVYAKKGKTIYVLPDAQRSFYANMTYGGEYFEYITEELPSICKSFFNISSKREDTAIIGVSMGGYGALKAAFSKPENYGMCAAFSSPFLFLKEGLEEANKNRLNPEFIAKYGRRLINDLISVFGEDLQCKEDEELLSLASKIRNVKNKPLVYMTCGSEDPFLDIHFKFYSEMKKLDFDITYESFEGGHNFYFFNESINKAIDLFSI